MSCRGRPITPRRPSPTVRSRPRPTPIVAQFTAIGEPCLTAPAPANNLTTLNRPFALQRAELKQRRHRLSGNRQVTAERHPWFELGDLASASVYDIWNPDIARYMEAQEIPGIISCQNTALALPLVFDPGEKWDYAFARGAGGVYG
jgi:hypothetical protein